MGGGGGLYHHPKSTKARLTRIIGTSLCLPHGYTCRNEVGCSFSFQGTFSDLCRIRNNGMPRASRSILAMRRRRRRRRRRWRRCRRCSSFDAACGREFGLCWDSNCENPLIPPGISGANQKPFYSVPNILGEGGGTPIKFLMISDWLLKYGGHQLNS